MLRAAPHLERAVDREPRSAVTDGLCSYSAAMKEIGATGRREVGPRLHLFARGAAAHCVDRRSQADREGPHVRNVRLRIPQESRATRVRSGLARMTGCETVANKFPVEGGGFITSLTAPMA